MENTLIIANKFGRLGNRLFGFAHFMGVAAEHDVKIINLGFGEYARFFKSTRGRILCTYPEEEGGLHWGAAGAILGDLIRLGVKGMGNVGLLDRVAKIVTIEERASTDMCAEEFYRLLEEHRLLIFEGWGFEAKQYMVKHQGEIAAYFTPVDRHADNVRLLMDRVRDTGDVIVGVHIRRGDYRRFREGKYYYDFAQYAQVMYRVKSLFPGQEVTFLVCADCTIDPSVFKDLKLNVGKGHLVEDMYALACCDYLIAPPSTFSGWASFYGQVPCYRIVDPDRPLSLSDFEIVPSLYANSTTRT